MSAWWSQLVGWISRAVVAVVSTARRLLAAIVRFAGLGPMVAVFAAQVVVLCRAARWLVRQVDALAAFLTSIADGARYPMTAWALADRWNLEVVVPMADGVRVSTDRTAVRDGWTGPAYEEYLRTVAEQADSADAAIADARIIRDQLQASADGTATVYLAILQVVLELLAVLAGAAIASETGVLAPVAVLGTVGAFCQAAAAIVGLVGTLVVVTGQFASVPEQLATVTSGWNRPHAVKFADASLADGDTTDWRLFH